MISQDDKAFFRDLLNPNLKAANSRTFPSVIERIAKLGEDFTRKMLIRYIENLDDSFRYSSDRTRNYYVKDNRSRTIITMLGEVTYKRTIYRDKRTNKNYCYVDEKLGIDKYIRYTNDVGAKVTEEYANTNSMIKVGRNIGSIIHSRFTLEDSDKYAIPRQTIFNLLHRSKEVRVLSDSKEEISDIYILMDEKYIGHQEKNIGKDLKDIMVKSAVIVEGLDKSHKRHKYIKPHYLSYVSNEFTSYLEDYIFSKYDIDKINKVHFLSDGGSWINGVYKDFVLDRKLKKRYLDKFHVFTALWSVSLDEEIYSSLINALNKEDKDTFLKLLDYLVKTYPDREEIIKATRSYISNNYEAVKNMLNLKDMNCAMEQAISHHIASQFTSVPKAYSNKYINLYLSLRDNYRNGENIKELYLKGVDCKDEILILNKPRVDQTIFERKNYINELNTKIGIKGYEDYNENSGVTSGQ